MTKELNVTINGDTYKANQGDTILDVVRRHKIDNIPTLCHDPKLPPYGSCYLCVVEIKGLEKLVPSCSSPVAEGMTIETNNERIRASRKTALELLLSNHYADCLGPCKQTCPANVDVQGYIALIAAGRYTDAVRLIKEKNPLPAVCGRVCVRECETACRRNLVDEGVGIDYLKRFVADLDLETPWTPELPPGNGRRVAVVGGGPAGLTCAYFLTMKGYGVTLFESKPKLGGMLRYGIPEYRLPKAMLDREIGWITGLGVQVKTNSMMGRDFTLASLEEEGFEAIFLALGAQKAKTMGLAEEEQTEGVIGGADFLRDMQLEEPPHVYGHVVVVGGGNTAIDAARTALRTGADKVTILYRRTQKEMPAHEMEVEAAIAEGVETIFLSAPLALVTDKSRVKALRCNRMELGAPDASGRRSPVALPGSEYDLACDFVISAIGQDIDLGGIKTTSDLKTTRQNAIVADRKTFVTSIPGVFAGGDVITGPAVAVDAIAHGRAAALSIDRYIQTGRAAIPTGEFVSRKEAFGTIPESEFVQIRRMGRERMAELPVQTRIKGLAEVECGLTEQQAAHETGRCLECGCSAYFDCDLRKYATDFGVDIGKFVGDVRKLKIDATHPFIALDPNKCINCGRCVRTCSEILKISALGFVHRGFKSVVKPSMEKRLLDTNCISCGNCIAACPTGAITEKVPFPKPGPWAFSEVESLCTFCSVGCNLSYRVFQDGLFTVSNVNGNSHNKGYLCTKGRFGYGYMMDKERLTKPMMRTGDGWREASWDEALDYAAGKMREVIARSGPGSLAVFASPKMTNEELYLLQRFARAGLKTNNIGSFSTLIHGVEQDALDDMFGITASTTTMDELEKAQVIVVMNADPSEENLTLELKIKAAQKRGARLVTITSSETPLVKFADLWVGSKRGTNTALISGVCNAIIEKGREAEEFIHGRTDNYGEFKEGIAHLDMGTVSEITGVKKEKLAMLVDMISEPETKVIVVYNIDSLWEKSRNDLKALGNLLLLGGRIGKPGNGIIIVRDYANSQGLLDMGVDPLYLPGSTRFEETPRVKEIGALWGTDLTSVFKPVNLKEALEKERAKGLLVFGEDPLLVTSNVKLTSGAEFMMVVDSFMTATALEADVVFPASLPIETEGTFTACDRRVQKLKRLFQPKSGMDTFALIKALSQRLGITTKTPEELWDEMGKANPFYRTLSQGKFWGNGFLQERFLTADGKGRFIVPDIDVTPYGGEKMRYLVSENYFRAEVGRRLAK